MKNIGIIGSTGKMGSALMALPHSPHIQLVPLHKKEESSAHLPFEILHALIDFSHVHATQKNLETALNHQLPIVIGTTGQTKETFDLINKASLTIPILYSSNFSIGITLMKRFIAHYSNYLTKSYVDISETHHIDKKDLPSGTALDLAALFPEKTPTLACPIKRSEEELIIHSHRLPSHAGAHTIQFTFKEETLSLHHHVLDRSIYAQGALLAAEFLLNQNSGLYSFSDVFESNLHL